MRNGYYVPPLIIEMDLHIRRRADPFAAGRPWRPRGSVYKIGHPALLLTVFDDDSVLCVEEHRARWSPENRFGRGQRRPLFPGAGFKVILAHFPHDRLKAIYPVIAQRFRQPGWVHVEDLPQDPR